MPDSLSHILDTISRLQGDSLLLSDSAKLDSISKPDYTNLIINHLPSGMEGVVHPSSPAAESWVFIVLAVLFFLLVTGIIQSADSFLENIKSFFSRKNSVELITRPTANIAQFQLFITAFTLSVFALFAQELLVKFPEKFHFFTFLIALGLFIGYYILKNILFEIVGNTFFDVKTTKNYKKIYFNLMNLQAILLFPILILYTFQPDSWHQPLLVSGIVVLSLSFLILIIRLFQTFFTKSLALFYIFLYLCTLEILPLIVLFQLSEKFIKSV